MNDITSKSSNEYYDHPSDSDAEMNCYQNGHETKRIRNIKESRSKKRKRSQTEFDNSNDKDMIRPLKRTRIEYTHPYALIIIDMQDGFVASQDDTLISNIEDMIEQAQRWIKHSL